MDILFSLIVIKIAEHVEKSIGHMRHNRERRDDHCSFDLNPDKQDFLTKFESLQRNIAMAWDGNLEAYAANMDPEMWSGYQEPT